MGRVNPAVFPVPVCAAASRSVRRSTVNGAWSAPVTLMPGVNVLTATDSNAFGTGASNAVTYTLGTPPTVTISSAGGATTSAAQTIAGTVDAKKRNGRARDESA